MSRKSIDKQALAEKYALEAVENAARTLIALRSCTNDTNGLNVLQRIHEQVAAANDLESRLKELDATRTMNQGRKRR